MPITMQEVKDTLRKEDVDIPVISSTSSADS
jgi:hypothetical protein